MNSSDNSVTIALRIPGPWANPGELIERLPDDCRMTAEGLIVAGGPSVEVGAAPADDQFPAIFRSSCRQPATAEELAAVDGYAVNVFLSGPGGSLDAARAMMAAAAAVVRAGGAGVFIDNSALAHGGSQWLALTDDGSPDAVSFAFVGLVAGRSDVSTMGMHVLGLRDITMRRADIDASGVDIVDVIRYVCQAETPIADGHVVADLGGPRFRAFAQDDTEGRAGSPMHNPFGRLKLVSLRDAAEMN